MNNTIQNHPIFIFHIIDEGRSILTLSDFDLHRLSTIAETEIIDYLSKNGFPGDEELKTDDGYAIIIRSNPGESNSGEREDVWSYAFDGETSLRDAFQRLNNQVDQLVGSLKLDMVVLSKDEIENRVRIVVSTFCDGTYYGLSQSLLN